MISDTVMDEIATHGIDGETFIALDDENCDGSVSCIGCPLGLCKDWDASCHLTDAAMT